MRMIKSSVVGIICCIFLSTLIAEPVVFNGKALSPLISVTPDTLRFVWNDSKSKTLSSSRSTTNLAYNQIDITPLNLMWPGPGTTPPNFTLPDTNSSNHSLSDFAGKVVWLNFWAST
ncbi:MAG: hypothetical protein PHX21_11225 [bacterium]|nr:hypothetical protein [bacterium]